MADPVQDYLDQLMGVYPEWVGGASKNAGYAPPDVGSQASQLNYYQDLAMTGMDPLQLWLADQINSGDLQSTFEEDEVIPAVTTGYDTLSKILQTSPMSVEGGIAAALLEGKTASQAIQEAIDSGAIQVPESTDANGKVTKDTSQLDRYQKFADQSWQALLGDKPEQRTPGKEILHPFVQRMLDAGFTDPRQQYTPEFVNPSITQFQQESDTARSQHDSALSAYQQARAAKPQQRQPSEHGAGAIHHAHQRNVGASRGSRGGLNNPAGAHKAQSSTQPSLQQMFRNLGATSERAAHAKKTAVQERAKARAVSDYMAQQYGTPAKAQFMAVIENLRRRGVGA